MICVELPIETDRLFIRPFNHFDHPNFLKFTLSDESTKYMDLTDEDKTFEGATAMFNQIIEGSRLVGQRQIYAIADKHTSQYLGCIGFIAEADVSMSLRYTININHTNNGLASEAVRAFLAHVGDNVTVRINCHPENLAAQAVAMKCGFTQIATINLASDASATQNLKIVFERICQNTNRNVA